MAKLILFLEKKLRIDKIGFLYLSSVLKNASYSVDMIQDDVDNAEELVNILLDLPLTEEHKKDMQDYRWNLAKSLLYGM